MHGQAAAHEVICYKTKPCRADSKKPLSPMVDEAGEVAHQHRCRSRVAGVEGWGTSLQQANLAGHNLLPSHHYQVRDM